MKKLSLLLLLFAGFNLQAQVNLLGISTYDGYNGNGFIYKLQNGNLQHVYDFISNDEYGKDPEFGLVEYNGLYYDVTVKGGNNDTGVIYTYDDSSSSLNVVYNFNRLTGYKPSSPLFLHNGKFYGTTKLGGDYDLGTLYEFDPATGDFVVLYNFISKDLGYHYANLIIENNVIYGIFSGGGIYGRGVLFSFNLLTNTYNVLHHFDPYNEGSVEFSNPVYYNGAVYGVLYYGNKIFKYDLSTQTFSIVNSFDPNQVGVSPYGYIAIDDGKIYGSSQNVQGTGGHIFQYDIDTNQLTSLYNDTDSFVNGIIKKGDLLYGFNVFGKVFTYDLSTSTYQYHFSVQEFGFFRNFITPVNSGKILFLNFYGGLNKQGALYEGDINNNTFQIKHEFNLAPQGAEPTGNLTLASNGKYYAVTSIGGSYGKGVIYEVDINGNYNMVYDIQYNYGMSQKLVAVGDKLYFVSDNNIMSIDINTYQLNYEANLGYFSDAYMLASNGKIYGVTYVDGIVYEFDPVTGNISLFGNDPQLRLFYIGMTEHNNKLYYVAHENHYSTSNIHYGALVSFDLNTHQIDLVKEFDDITGYYTNKQTASLTVLHNKIYGHTHVKGANGKGTLFKYEPSNNTFSVILDLTEKNRIGQKLLPVGDHTLLGTFGDKIMAFDVQNATQNVVYDLSQKDIYYSYLSLTDIGTTALDKEVLAHFEVYPNPMQDVLHIENKDDKYLVTAARIYDISGKEKINTAEFDNIDVSKLSKGIYILQLQLDNGNSVQQLLLKK